MNFDDLGKQIIEHIALYCGFSDTRNPSYKDHYYPSWFIPGVPVTPKFLQASTRPEELRESTADIFFLSNRTSNLTSVFDGNVVNNQVLNTDYNLARLIELFVKNMKVISVAQTDEQRERQSQLTTRIDGLYDRISEADMRKTLSGKIGELNLLEEKEKVARKKVSNGIELTLEEQNDIVNYGARYEELNSDINRLRRRITDIEDEIARAIGEQMSLVSLDFLDDKAKIQTDLDSEANNIRQTVPPCKITTFRPHDFGTEEGQQSWTRLTCKKNSEVTTTSSSNYGVRGNVGLFGFFGLGGGGGNTETHTNTIVDDYEISFSLVKVAIERPWLRSNFLSENWWTFDTDILTDVFLDGYNEEKDRRVAAGMMQEGDHLPLAGPQGFIMGYPVEAIFIKDLSIKLVYEDNGIKTSFANRVAGGGFSWGIFSFGGRYYGNSTETVTWNKLDEDTISIEGVQLIGFVNKYFSLLPKPPIERFADHYR